MFSTKSLITLQPVDRFLKFQCLLVPLFKHNLLCCLPNPLPVSARSARRALRKASLTIIMTITMTMTLTIIMIMIIPDREDNNEDDNDSDQEDDLVYFVSA